MRRVGNPRALAAVARSGGNLAQRCFLRNSFSGPGGRGRGAGIGVPRGPIGAAVPESEEKDVASGVGRGQGIDGNQQQAGEVGDDGVEWRDAVQRRISLMDVQNRAADGGPAGRGRGIGIGSASEDPVGGRSIPFSAQSDAFPGIGRGRGINVVPQQSGGRGRIVPIPALGAAGRGLPQSPLGSSIDSEKVSSEIPSYEEESEVRASPAQVEATPPIFRRIFSSPLGNSSEPERVSSDIASFAEDDSELRASPAKVEATPPSAPRIFFAPQISLPSAGRGRGHVEEAAPSIIGAEMEESQQVGRVSREAGRGQQKSSRAQRLQLSTEEARARAIAILEEGIEKNVAAEGERRRKAGMEKFADATEIFADRFKREPGQAPSQTQRTRKERERPKRPGPRRGPRSADELSLSEPSVEEQLTPEQEAELLRLDNESTFKENLHRLFLVQFEPEYAMEDFGRNPDIDEPPVLSLEEYLQKLKPMFLRKDAELSEEQKWQEAVQASLAHAPQLEKLVEAYAGRGRMTARQQIQKMEAISNKLPTSVPPEVSAFTQRALITLQNNPGLTFKQKERLMNNLVSGFSSG
ncbi:hypothetical protein AXG93_1130s1040 [Marchantia polymorpha subsp. ruderalis]|uniref:Uncharacterized protein n=1 Tax=Marchantia polymorpha subsp. ruderalis TaxID=1480154 RepID=A0A176VHP6_MARPO|nr:hypothetical protein AXG93_1130s1040 [Marchantia polymorpha subsp. ruderalis]